MNNKKSSPLKCASRFPAVRNMSLTIRRCRVVRLSAFAVISGTFLTGCSNSASEFEKACASGFDVVIFDKNEWNAYLARAISRFNDEKTINDSQGIPTYFSFFSDDKINYWSRSVIVDYGTRCNKIEPVETYIATENKGVFAIMKDHRFKTCGFGAESVHTCSSNLTSIPKINFTFAENAGRIERKR